MDTRKAAMQVGSICLKVAIFVVIVLGIVYLGQNAYRYTHVVFSDTALEKAPGKNIEVKISEDINGKHLAKVLEEKGLIKDATVFLIQMKLEGLDDNVKAGTYQLNTSMAPSEMIKILSGRDEEEET